MNSYDSWKLATPPEYEREEQDDDDVVVRRPCDVCQLLDCECFDAADGGEENDDMMDPDKMMEPKRVEWSQSAFVNERSTLELVSLRNAIEIELKRRKDDLSKDLQAVEHALAGTKPRARRSDAGRPRAAKENAA